MQVSMNKGKHIYIFIYIECIYSIENLFILIFSIFTCACIPQFLKMNNPWPSQFMQQQQQQQHQFTESYRAYPMAMLQGQPRDSVNYGGKIILPPSALARLASLHIAYPMQFSLSSPSIVDTTTTTTNIIIIDDADGNGSSLGTHAGVLEFIAEEGIFIPTNIYILTYLLTYLFIGRVYLPQWMMRQLQIEPGDIIQVKNATLPLGKFLKIQPQSVNFLDDISDPKAV